MIQAMFKTISHKNILRTIGSIALSIALVGVFANNQTRLWQFISHLPGLLDLESSQTVTQVSKTEEQIALANNQFGFGLFHEAYNLAQGNNILLSPPSLAIALTMIYSGAKGETQQAIASTLNFSQPELLNLEEIDLGYQKLQQSWQKADDLVQFSFAHSLWAKEGVSFKHQFLKHNRKYYFAQITNLNFANLGTKNIINSWVRSATQGRIEYIAKATHPEDILLLIDAASFKGNWANQFDLELTQSELFHLSEHFSKPHLFMSHSGDYQYYNNGQFQAISLPFAGDRLSMYIFLPDKSSSLADLAQKLNLSNWKKWTEKLQWQSGNLKIPRFRLEYETSLNKALTNLGMGIVFQDDRANFSDMTSKSVSLDRITQKTWIEVNETGVKSAKLEDNNDPANKLDRVNSFDMVVNRPFFLAIEDERTGTILFMGSIVDPG